jgi:succinate dehydrogenase / fumarate reductase, cytochrome b subunit
MRNTLYKGREGHWAFILHRISGLAVLFYLLLHVFDISLVMYGPDGPFNDFLAFYHHWPFRIGLVLVMAGVVYHGLNGLRLIMMDFSSWGVKYQRGLWYSVLVTTTLIGIPVLLKVVPEIVRGM